MSTKTNSVSEAVELYGKEFVAKKIEESIQRELDTFFEEKVMQT